MGITRGKDELLKDMNSKTVEQVDDENNEIESGSFMLPYGREFLFWEVSFDPLLKAIVSITRQGEQQPTFELNDKNRSKVFTKGSRTYRRDLIVSLNPESTRLILNGTVCGSHHPEDPRGWRCTNYNDTTLFGW